MKILEKFEPEYPYSLFYKCAYRYKADNGRMYLHLVTLGDKPSTRTPLARYKMAVHLKRFIEPWLEVDHRDDDFTNDDINNLQLLTGAANTRKHHLRKKGFLQGETPQICIICEGTFFDIVVRKICFKPECKSRLRSKLSKELGLTPPQNQQFMKIVLPKEKVDEIHRLKKEGFGSRRIAKILGVSKWVVSCYLRGERT